MVSESNDRTIAILLGASEFPSSKTLEPARAFRESHDGLLHCLLDVDLFNIPPEDVLDLFDSDLSSTAIDASISAWLTGYSAPDDTSAVATNLLIHYVGHGGFRDDSQEYYLAIRATSQDNPYFTSIAVASLARTLREKARSMRRFIVIDACFSAAAVAGFQARASETVRQKVLEQNWNDDTMTDRANLRSGTALVCSSSRYDPSRFLDDSGTMFTGALVGVLRDGAQLSVPRMSMQLLHQLTWERMRRTHLDRAIRPEIHCPDQRLGDISKAPVFPNAKFLSQLKRLEAENCGVDPGTQGQATAPVQFGLSIEDMYALLQSANELASELDYASVLQDILSKAGELTNSKDGAILLYKHDEVCEGQMGCFYFAAAIGEKAEELLSTRGELSNNKVPMTSIAGRIFTDRVSAINQDVAADSNHYKGVDLQTDIMTDSIVCVPLVAAGVGLGVMQVLNTNMEEYTERDRTVLEHLANQASTAIRNARLVKKLLASVGFPVRHGAPDNPLDVLAKINMPADFAFITIMFIDMRGFTELCISVGSPVKIQSLLNSYFSFLTESVSKYNGVVNKFLGDGLLAIFSEGDHARQSVDCAVDIVNAFPSFYQNWKRKAKINQATDYIDVGIGIVTDDIILGTVGNNLIHDYTVIGAPVNLAAALEFNARAGSRILIDANTFYSLDSELYTCAGPKENVLTKSGKGLPVGYEVYEVKGKSID